MISPGVHVLPSQLPRDALADDIQRRADAFLRRMGATTSSIQVDIKPDGIPAFALGFFAGGVASGRITVTRELLDLLSSAELDFVVAHECAHIMQNHLAASAIHNAGPALLRELGKDNGVALAGYFALEAFQAAPLLNGEMHMAQRVSVDQETEADWRAVLCTGDHTSGRNALWRMAGENPDHGSHEFRVLGAKLSTMTISQRIAILDENVENLRRQGYDIR